MQFLEQVVSHSRKESTVKEYHIQNDEYGFRDCSQWLHIMIQFNDLLPLMFSPISKFFRAHSFLSCPVLFNPFCMRQIKIIYAKSDLVSRWLHAVSWLIFIYVESKMQRKKELKQQMAQNTHRKKRKEKRKKIK